MKLKPEVKWLNRSEIEKLSEQNEIPLEITEIGGWSSWSHKRGLKLFKRRVERNAKKKGCNAYSVHDVFECFDGYMGERGITAECRFYRILMKNIKTLLGLFIYEKRVRCSYYWCRASWPYSRIILC